MTQHSVGSRVGDDTASQKNSIDKVTSANMDVDIQSADGPGKIDLLKNPQQIHEMFVRGEISSGVARVMAINSVATTWDRGIMMVSLFLLAYSYGLDNSLRYSLQANATASFGQHSLLAFINVIGSAIGAVAQICAAKLSDFFGRNELLMFTTVVYCVGTILEAASHNIETYTGGAVLFRIGATMYQFLVGLIIADMTSTRSRLFFTFIPYTPYIINAWAAPSVLKQIGTKNWRWGIGMWALITFVFTVPVCIQLWSLSYRAKKRGLLVPYMPPQEQSLGWKDRRSRAWVFTQRIFWEMDVFGVIILVALLACLLSPLTLAGGMSTKWKQGYIIAPIVVGFCCIPLFIFWELKVASHPCVPFRFMKDRMIYGTMLIAFFLNFAWAMQADYLYTVLQVSFGFSASGANRVSLLYSFVSTITGTVLGIVVFWVRYLKWFIVAGASLCFVAFGLLIHFRGTNSSANKSGIIGAEVLLGLAGGLFPTPSLSLMQTILPNSQLGILISIFFSIFNVGGAFGNTVSGAMWTQVLPNRIINDFKKAGLTNMTASSLAYANPFGFIAEYPYGTPERAQVVESYKHIQRLLCIVGICLLVPAWIGALVLRNPRLSKRQTLFGQIDESEESEKVYSEEAQVKSSKKYSIPNIFSKAS